MKSLLSAFWRYNRYQVLALFLLMLTVSALEGVSLLLVIPLLSFAGVSFSGHAGPWLGAHLVKGVHISLWGALLVYCLILILYGGLQFARQQYSVRVRLNFTNRLCEALYSALVRANWHYIAKQKSSHISHLMTTEMMRLGSSAYLLLQILSGMSLLVVYALLSFWVSWEVTVLLLLVSLIVLISLKSFNRASHRSGKLWFTDMRLFYQKIENQLDSLKLTKSFGLEKHQESTLHQMNQTLTTHMKSMSRVQGSTLWIYQSVTVVMISVIFFVSLDVLHTQTAWLVGLLLLCARISPRISQLHNQYQQLLNVLPSFQVLQSALDEARAVEEPLVEEAIPLQDSVEFDHVSFHYRGTPSADQAEWKGAGIDEISFRLKAGQMMAIVGKSGAGKSTLADLLAGLLSPDSGVIRMDGVPLDSRAQIGWRHQVGYVTQSPFLLNDTIRHNLCLADLSATDEMLWDALRKAGACDFVRRLPQGLDTEVGGQTFQISGGEAQRLSLARIFLRKPALLILDEATSHLDAHHEELIQDAIAECRGRLTVVVIAHRLSTVRNADWIIVLDQGKMVQEGPWTQLASEPGHFQDLLHAKEREIPGEPDVLEQRDISRELEQSSQPVNHPEKQ